MNSTFGFLDIILAVSGIYLIYTAVQMKRTGEINNSVMVGKGYDLKKAKDLKGYIEYMYLKTIIMGVLIIVSSALDYMNENYWKIPYFSIGIYVVFWVLIIVYGKLSTDAQKKYLSPASQMPKYGKKKK